MALRTIRTIFKSHPTLEGAGVLVYRAFGLPQVPEMDPFLLLDEFASNTPENYLPGFPFHPHRGFETITYVLRGSVEHKDSLGNTGVIQEGDVQWMTAGNGIIHQEMPKGDKTETVQGYQVWLNLPASEKMMNPRYREIRNTEIPMLTQDSGAMIRVIAGSIKNVQGPVQGIVTDPQFFDVTLPPNGRFSHQAPSEHTVVAYVMEGGAYFDDRREPYIHEIPGGSDDRYEREALVRSRHAILYGEGDEVSIQGGPEGSRLLYMTARPLNESVAWSGSIVMNTEEELRKAYDEVRTGTFVKYGKSIYVR